jgi:hypothetical protein
MPVRRWTWAVALAAGLALAFGARAWWSYAHPASYYEVTGIAGLERAHVGDSIETNADQTAIVRVAALGDVEVQPGSRIRVDDMGADLHKLYLDRGAVTALILAKPGVFQIGTPSGLSIDLGCKYELRVDDAGTTHMKVLTGRVKFAALGKTVVVPHGAECEATRGLGPNVPVRVEASDAFRQAARRLELVDQPSDFGKFTMFGSDEDNLLVFDNGDAHEDSVTLFHLFTNARSEAVSSKALEMLLIACSPPDGVTSDMLRARDLRAIDAWRSQIAERFW